MDTPACNGRDHLELSVEALVAKARQTSCSLVEAQAIYVRALRLDPLRLDIHVELAELEALDGDIVGAVFRMRMLADQYAEQDRRDEARCLLSGSAPWEEEFDEAWEAVVLHSPDPTTKSSVPPPPLGPAALVSRERREEIFSRYSVQTLRARMKVRNDPSITRRRPGEPLAHSLRRLGRDPAR